MVARARGSSARGTDTAESVRKTKSPGRGKPPQVGVVFCRSRTRAPRRDVDRPRAVCRRAEPPGDLGVPTERVPATTGALLRYVRSFGGDDAVARVLDLAGVPYSAEQLEDQALWWSYATRIRLFEAATEVVGDPRLMFRVGAAALDSGLAHSIVILLRAMGTPRQVFRQLPRAVAKFSTTSTMEIVESGATAATIRFTLHPGFEHSRLDCMYAQGLLTTVPTVFGLRPAQIEHDECESDGAPSCVYRLTWDRRSRLPGRRRDGRARDLELTALRGQLHALQSASTDL